MKLNKPDTRFLTKILTIDGIDVSNSIGYVFDGCHKFYILRTERDLLEAVKEWGDGKTLDFKPIARETLFTEFLHSCPLRFIHNWDLTDVIPQDVDHEVEFEFADGTIGVYDPEGDYEFWPDGKDPNE